MRQAIEQGDRLLISVREAAARLGIGRDATYALVREGRLPVVRVGRRVLIPARALALWIEEEVGSSAPSTGTSRAEGAGAG
jgi:excisionase family DNA binding protein